MTSQLAKWLAALESSRNLTAQLEALIHNSITTQEQQRSTLLEQSLLRSLQAGNSCRTVHARPAKWNTNELSDLLGRQCISRITAPRWTDPLDPHIYRELAWSDLGREFTPDLDQNHQWLLFDGENSDKHTPQTLSSAKTVPFLKSCRILMAYHPSYMARPSIFSSRYPAWSMYEHDLVFISSLDVEPQLHSYTLPPDAWAAPQTDEY